MPRLQRKALSTPDIVRTFPHGHVDIVNLDETYIARLSWEPGWRWSKDVAPVVQTTSCQNRHLGYALTGTLRASDTSSPANSSPSARGGQRALVRAGREPARDVRLWERSPCR